MDLLRHTIWIRTRKSLKIAKKRAKKEVKKLTFGLFPKKGNILVNYWPKGPFRYTWSTRGMGSKGPK
jgi:hypothetical protein